MTKQGEGSTEHITTYMRIDSNGDNVTDIYRDGVFIRTEPTHPSQIRKPRVSCLWKPGDDKKDEKQPAWKVKLSELKKALASRGQPMRTPSQDPSFKMGGAFQGLDQ